MEELNNVNEVEEIIVVEEPVEVLDSNKSDNLNKDNNGLVIGAVIATAVIGGAIGLKKLWDKKKAKKATRSEHVIIMDAEVASDSEENNDK